MNKKEFKTVLCNVFIDFDFRVAKNRYWYETDDLFIIVYSQKSNYDDHYFLNYGFVIKDINPDISIPSSNQFDLVGRFLLDGSDVIPYTQLSEDFLTKHLKKELEVIMHPIIDKGLLYYLEINPQMKNLLSLNAIKLLGIG